MGHNLSVSGTVPVWLGVVLKHRLRRDHLEITLASSRPLWSGLTSLIKLPLAPGAVSDQRSARPLPSENQLSAQKLSRGVRVISLNLINYLLISEIVKYFALANSALVVTATIFTLFDLIPQSSRAGLHCHMPPHTSRTWRATLLHFCAIRAASSAPDELQRPVEIESISRRRQRGQNRSRTINAIIVTAGALASPLVAVEFRAASYQP